jgi:hypothetical protein
MKNTCLTMLVSFVVITLQSGISNAKDSITNSLEQSEELISAFYSLDPQLLEAELAFAESSKPQILFYQGWAKGGGYQIVNRKPCIQNENKIISCSITVKDDLMKALGIPFDVTDTFHLTFINENLIKVTTSSNDLQVFRDAEKWVWENLPQLVTHPCNGYFEGGTTPEKCIKAMVKGYAEFAKSKDFPRDVKF